MSTHRKSGRSGSPSFLRTSRTPKWLAKLAAIAIAIILLTVPNALADRTKLKPGINSFSPQQDIEMGRKLAAEVKQKMPMCNSPKIDAYLTKLGVRLVAQLNTNGVKYPWEFHCVNDKAINAFALPGGFVFVNRGAIEIADNEAQLAGVMAHELSHVALRHGTNQATKAQYMELGTGILGIAGGIVGGAAGAAAAGAGQFVFGSVLLKYSRGAETQADVMGTQVLYDGGYDPRALAAFFENLNAQAAEKNPPEFFSDHPNPDHRIGRVQEEIAKLGGVPADARKDSAEFEAIKREVAKLPAPPKVTPAAKPRAGGIAFPPPGVVKVETPSASYKSIQAGKISLNYPDNWKSYGKDSNVTVAPDGGIVDSGKGQPELAYGFSVSVARMEGQKPQGSDQLQEATQKLIERMRQENEGLEITRDSREVTLNGERGLSTFLRNASPVGGKEVDWLVTVMRPEGLVYFVAVAPEAEYERFRVSFESVLDSVRFQK
jgi:beta-barrel assembly-enhancing protease